MKKNELQLNEVEITMFKEVFEVMSKYASQTRTFGLQLVHSHFQLKPGEVLYETHDERRREIEVRPVHLSNLQHVPLATAWHETRKGNITVSMFCCDGGHSKDR